MIDKFEHDGNTLGRGQVDADVSLAGVLLHEVARQSVATRRGEAGEIASGRFDLDDVCAHVAQHARAVWSRENASEIEDTDAVQRGRHTPCLPMSSRSGESRRPVVKRLRLGRRPVVRYFGAPSIDRQ